MSDDRQRSGSRPASVIPEIPQPQSPAVNWQTKLVEYASDTPTLVILACIVFVWFWGALGWSLAWTFVIVWPLRWFLRVSHERYASRHLAKAESDSKLTKVLI